MKYPKCHYLCIVGAGVIIAFTPYLLTCNAIHERFNFTETGNIGDTIGGITAPFVGMLNVVLLYITLHAQLNFNKKQARDNDLSHLIEIQTTMITYAEGIEYKYSVDKNGHSSPEQRTKKGLSTLCDFDEGEVRQFSLNCMESLVFCLQNITNLGKSLLCITSQLDSNIVVKREFEVFVKRYFNQILSFYENVEGQNIKLSETALGIFKDGEDCTEKEVLLKMVKRYKVEINEELKKIK